MFLGIVLQCPILSFGVSFLWIYYDWNRVLLHIFVDLSSSNFSFMIELKSIILSMNKCCSLFLLDSFSWWPYSLVDKAPIELLNGEMISSYSTIWEPFIVRIYTYSYFSVNQLDLVELLSWVLQSYRFFELKMYASRELMLLTIHVRILVCSGLTLLSVRY